MAASLGLNPGALWVWRVLVSQHLFPRISFSPSSAFLQPCNYSGSPGQRRGRTEEDENNIEKASFSPSQHHPPRLQLARTAGANGFLFLRVFSEFVDWFYSFWAWMFLLFTYILFSRISLGSRHHLGGTFRHRSDIDLPPFINAWETICSCKKTDKLLN